jgi:hypothetical protein
MPRKSSKKEIDLRNVELIITAIKEKTKSFKDIIKYDGITIEFSCNDDVDRTTAAQEVETICKELNLKQYVVENSGESETKFILQFPDMTPSYTEDEMNAMYIANFKWLLDDSLRNKPDLTKQYILDHTASYVKLAVTTYFRSNVNQYKEHLEDYLNNTTYRQKYNILFMTYLDEYWANR